MNDINGTVFGYWTATSETQKCSGSLYVFCKCKCGTAKYVRLEKLRNGTSKSCGCYQREMNTTHGMTATSVRRESREYWVWNSMVRRCTNAKDAGYKNYGGRGITVCDKWLTYVGFIEDMGFRPSDAHSIDRLDNNKGYCKENCAWVIRTNQARNKRNNRIIEINGVKKTLAEWSEISGVSYTAIIHRINSGWPIEEAVMKPARKMTRSAKAVPATA